MIAITSRTLGNHRRFTNGRARLEWGNDSDAFIDEDLAAYKDINQAMTDAAEVKSR